MKVDLAAPWETIADQPLEIDGLCIEIDAARCKCLLSISFERIRCNSNYGYSCTSWIGQYQSRCFITVHIAQVNIHQDYIRTLGSGGQNTLRPIFCKKYGKASP